MGIERVRYRRPVHPGDVVEIEAIVRRLRSRMGVLRGIARVDGQVVVEGTMTFALGPRTRDAASGGRSARNTSSTIPTFAARDAHTAHLASGSK